MAAGKTGMTRHGTGYSCVSVMEERGGNVLYFGLFSVKRNGWVATRVIEPYVSCLARLLEVQTTLVLKGKLSDVLV